jgi:hypothetical protein
LHRVPAEDQVKDLLFGYITENKRQPPPNWDGVIQLPNK